MPRLPLRLWNATARALERLGRRPPGFAASEPALLDAARRATGLDDFGEPGFREGLGVLLRAYDEESRLTPFGRFLVRQELAGILASRLAVVEAWKRDPGVLAAPIRRPLFVLGLPRTGTSALHALLAQDPAHQVLEYWIAASPRPRPPRSGWEREPAYRSAERALRTTYWLDPGLRAIHDLRADGPEECRHLLQQSFSDDTFDSNATIPSYTAWFARRDLRPAYAWHRDVLKLVGSTSPERRWVLKYPAHLRHLRALLETYPDACVVQTHRDPARVLPSLCSLVSNWRSIYEDGVDPAGVARWQVEMWAGRIAHALRVRDSDDAKRYCDLHFREISDDPVGAPRRIYAHFGFAWSEATERRMSAWARANPPGRHGGHGYRAEDSGLREDALRERFADYARRFGVQPEPAGLRSGR